MVSHTRRYRISKLVYFEFHDRMANAIQREKNLKYWRRAWKVELIETTNPTWKDLTDQLIWLD
jgi:putative endonuclease